MAKKECPSSRGKRQGNCRICPAIMLERLPTANRAIAPCPPGSYQSESADGPHGASESNRHRECKGKHHRNSMSSSAGQVGKSPDLSQHQRLPASNCAKAPQHESSEQRRKGVHQTARMKSSNANSAQAPSHRPLRSQTNEENRATTPTQRAISGGNDR